MSTTHFSPATSIEDALPKLTDKERNSGELSVSLAENKMFSLQRNLMRVEFNRWIGSPESCWVAAKESPAGLRKAETELVSKAALAGLFDMADYLTKNNSELDEATILKVTRPALVATFLLEGPATFEQHCPVLHPIATCSPTYLIACDFLLHYLSVLWPNNEIDQFKLSTFLGNDYASTADWAAA